MKMKDVMNKVEALLFSSARSMSVEEISQLVKVDLESVKEALGELKKKYETSEAVELIKEGEYWKLTVHDKYVPLVSKIVTQTELSKTLMETLAVIAFRYPIKQSDLIKIRTNKAYDHLKLLEEHGFITRQRYGRTRLIKLAQKFFDYFDLPREKLKEKFKDFDSLASAIEEKEGIIDKMKREKAGKGKDPEIDLVDEKGHKVKLEVIDEPELKEDEEEKKEAKVVEDKEMIGKLEVVDEPEQQEEAQEEDEKEIEEENKEEIEETTEPLDMDELEEKKIKKKIEDEVDRKVDELLHYPKEEKEEEEDSQDLLESIEEERAKKDKKEEENQ